ncbi:MAG: hypothetical protein EXX96DRAFT_582384 [Benjaminiella poitrasii]|nr:MAG: hypothetical protein EXX96DRAFT_582384 [Benjaminiella poitrasii]
MTNDNNESIFEQLPFELISKISENLKYPDIWYLGTCSRKSRHLSHQLLKTKYHIDLLVDQQHQQQQASLHTSFDHLIHAAVAHLERYGITRIRASDDDEGHNRFIIEPSVLQSVANHMAIAINDRVLMDHESNDERHATLNSLLDKTLGILIDHYLLDPELGDYSVEKTFKPTSIERKLFLSDREWKLLNLQPEESSLTCILLADYLAVLHETLGVIFYDACFLSNHRRILLNHLQRQLGSIRLTYQKYHIDRLTTSSSLTATDCDVDSPANSFMMDDDNIVKATLKEKSREFVLLIQFLCALIQADLLSSSDVDQFVNAHVHRFFITQPSDLRYTLANTTSAVGDGSSSNGLTILLHTCSNNSDQQLTITHDINHTTTTTTNQCSSSYLWKLWLSEIQLRLQVLLDILRFLIIKNIANSNRRHGVEHITSLLEDTIHALSITSTIYKSASNIPI